MKFKRFDSILIVCLFVLLVMDRTGGQAQPSNCVPAPPNLVSWWRSEGDATDYLGLNNGTPEGTLSYTTGAVNQSFLLNGTDADVALSASPSLDIGAGDGFTIELWVNPTSVTISRPMVEWANGTTLGVQFWILPDPPGSGPGCLFANIVDTGGTFHYIGSPAGAASANTNQHVALTYDRLSGIARIYRNGIVVAQEAFGTFASQTTFNLNFGARKFATPQVKYSGKLDEISFYNRALFTEEIRAIYDAGSAGKCLGSALPMIVIQPTNHVAFTNSTTSFSVYALGTAPFTYQWRYNGTNIGNATDATLVLSDVQTTNAGSYSVVVGNALGEAISSNAVLTVTNRSCTPPIAGLINWWRAEGDATDAVSGANGFLTNGAAFSAGKVGQAFDLNSSGSFVAVPDTNLWSFGTNGFTVELWAKFTFANPSLYSEPGAPLVASDEGHNNLLKWWFAHGGNELTFHYNGPGIGPQWPLRVPFVPQLNEWYHLALVRNGNVFTIFINGLAAGSATVNISLPDPTVPLTIGSAEGYSFTNGLLDEVSLYGRALSPQEIRSIYDADEFGKCFGPVPPWIILHPLNTNRTAGANVTFTTIAAGSVPLSYQWRFNGAPISGATKSTLALTNLQFSNVGAYSVQVSNVAGVIISSNANLSVVLPTAVIRAGNATIIGGKPVTIPVTIVANGNEASTAFSINYTTTRVVYTGATLGSNAVGATMLVNTNQIGSGRIGVAVAFPPQATFPVGTNEVVRLNFDSLPLLGASPNSSSISFGDTPFLRELLDGQYNTLPANYTSGTLTVQPTIYEADVSPRTNGNQTLSTTDWQQIGRFVARLDAAAGSNEFQRIDCAPRDTGGDGQLKVNDWVQAARYVAGWDAPNAIGGPVVEVAPTIPAPVGMRRVRAGNTNVVAGQPVIVPVNLTAVVNEHAVGFTMTFDPTRFTYVQCEPGDGSAGASLTLNTNQIGNGKLGVVLALPLGSSFPVGVRELIRVRLIASPSASGLQFVTLTDDVVTRCVSDTLASDSGTAWQDGQVTVASLNPQPTLTITRSNDSVRLSWPVTAVDFALQVSTNVANTAWTNAPAQPQTNGSEISVLLPATNQLNYFRLLR